MRAECLEYFFTTGLQSSFINDIFSCLTINTINNNLENRTQPKKKKKKPRFFAASIRPMEKLLGFLAITSPTCFFFHLLPEFCSRTWPPKMFQSKSLHVHHHHNLINVFTKLRDRHRVKSGLLNSHQQNISTNYQPSHFTQADHQKSLNLINTRG